MDHVAAYLGPYMFYLSARIDAADRRAAFVLAGVAGVFAFITNSKMQGLEGVTVIQMAVEHLAVPSVVVCLLSGLLSGLATFPRKFSSNAWPSQIFLGEVVDAENILKNLQTPELAAKELIEFQGKLGRLVRIKNTLSGWAIVALGASFGLFLFGY